MNNSKGLLTKTIPNAFSLTRKTGLALLRSTKPGMRLALRARLAYYDFLTLKQ